MTMLPRPASLFTGVLLLGVVSAAQSPAGAAQVQPAKTPPSLAAAPVAATIAPRESTDYTIGADDVLTVTFWREKDMSADVVVRPDGKITLPLLNDVQAAGLSTKELREKLVVEAKRFVEDPNPTVVVKQINSRKVFITGSVEKPGPYTLTAPTTVLQLIAMAGGLKEYAHSKDIVIMRTMSNGHPTGFRFNFKEVADRRNLRSNIELKPGDTVVVP